jgi:hypothetical protein
MSHADKADKLLIKPGSGRQTGVAASLGQIIRKARNAASHPKSHKQHDNNQAGDGPRQTDSTESHSHPNLPRVGGAVRGGPVDRTRIVPGAACKPRIIFVADVQAPPPHSVAVTSRSSGTVLTRTVKVPRPRRWLSVKRPSARL